jgi:hypothetical protein
MSYLPFTSLSELILIAFEEKYAHSVPVDFFISSEGNIFDLKPNL